MANLLISCFRRAATVWAQVWQCLVKWLHVAHWISAPRDHPPDTLTDPKWGRHQHILVDNLMLHYVENGSSRKPLVLFLHGIPHFWYTWRYQLQEFSANYWTVALDLPGFGRSDEPHHPITYRLSNLARIVCDLVVALGKTDCILVGHGFGALLGWHIVNQYPERVSKYVMMRFPSVGIMQDLDARSAIPLGKLLKLAFLSHSRTLPVKLIQAGDYAFFTTLLGRFAKPQDLEAYKYTYSQPDAISRAITAIRENLADVCAEEFSYRVRKPATIPGLFLAGENDWVIRLPEISTLMISKYHPLETRVIPRTDRLPHQEEPSAVNRIIRQFLESTVSRAHVDRMEPRMSGMGTRLVFEGVCANCYTMKHTTVHDHRECANRCDGVENMQTSNKRKIPICS